MGRYSLTKKRRDVAREVGDTLRVELAGREAFERHNVAPTEEVLAVVQNRDGRRAEMLRWGLVPYWAKDGKTKLTMINTRAETLSERPAYRRLFERGSRRCLVVADGFYEWIKAEDPAQPRRPLRFALADGVCFCFAGLWTNSSCTVVTTVANELVAPVHDRMPVLLSDPAAWEAWLDPALEGEAVAPLLRPFPAELMAVAEATLQPPSRQT